MQVLAWVITTIVAMYLGYILDRVLTRLKKIESALKEKMSKRKEDSSKSYFYDPYDPVQAAKIEREKLMKKLNPED